MAVTPTNRKRNAGDPIELAVIGGGPKAAALTAKAKVLRDTGRRNVQVTIFEPDGIGAYWRGRAGYTDGEQRLCTLAERDVGYPYTSLFGKEVDLRMAADYSWGRFLHERPSGYEHGFRTWLDAGRKPPYHASYADYLSWVVQSASARPVVEARVVELAKDGELWRIRSRHGADRPKPHKTRFDGVVVTGPGPARQIGIVKKRGVTASPMNIFNGRDFWQRAEEVRRCLKEIGKRGDDDAEIVIVGAGGTAAAVLSWLIGEGARDRRIVIVASQASLYTRVDSVFENRLFSDETVWETLSKESRRAFFDRLNRGVVWATVMDRVATASGLTMLDGRAESMQVDSSGQLSLSVERGDKAKVQLRPSLLIDATGFDPWWFLRMIKGWPRTAKRPDGARREAWELAMSKNLSLTGDPWDGYPPLHAPMVSSHIGPGYGSLMVLGAMADRILGAYA